MSVDWTELPSELLQNRIWNMLPFRSTIAAGLACKAWHSAFINVYSIDVGFSSSKDGFRISEPQFHNFISQFENLYSVTLVGASHLSWNHLQSIAGCSGSTLNSLALNLSSGTTLNGTTWKLTESFPALQHLDLKCCIVPLSSVVPSVFPPTLQSLRLSSCLKVTDESLISLSGFLKGLTRFEARGVYRLTDKGMSSILQSNPGITSLDLSSLMNLTNNTLICATTHCRNMTTFVARATNFSGEALSTIGSAWGGSLTHLALKMCPRLTEEDISERLLPGLKNLLVLDLQKAPLSETSPILRTIADHCPKLQSLDLRDCTQWKTPVGDWKYFFDGCPSMTSLYIRSPLVFDHHIEEITINAPNLTALYLQECTSITHQGIQHVTDAVLSGRLRKLYRLTITDIPFDHDIVEEITSKCKSVLTTHRKPPRSNPQTQDQ